LDLEWAEPFSFNRPHVNLQGTKTGDDGGFIVEHVPAGNLRFDFAATAGLGMVKQEFATWPRFCRFQRPRPARHSGFAEQPPDASNQNNATLSFISSSGRGGPQQACHGRV
jgi:hypothetical protein